MKAGKTALILAGMGAGVGAGAGLGLLRSLRVTGDVNRNAAGLDALVARVDTIHVAVSRLADQTEQLQAGLRQMVTKEELTQTLDRVFGQLERVVDARFEHQTRSVDALRSMILQTDEMLQRVLDGLESIHSGGEPEPEGQNREWKFSQAAH